MVDAADLKSVASNGVRVQVPPRALFGNSLQYLVAKGIGGFGINFSNIFKGNTDLEAFQYAYNNREMIFTKENFRLKDTNGSAVVSFKELFGHVSSWLG